MTERERLISILDKTIAIRDEDTYDYIEWLADELLDNDIIVPQCKVGDVIYKVRKDFTLCSQGEYPDSYWCEGCNSACDSKTIYFIDCGKVKHIQKNAENITVVVNWESTYDKKDYIIGKEVFLTKEEAKKALKEREIK